MLSENKLFFFVMLAINSVFVPFFFFLRLAESDRLKSTQSFESLSKAR